MLLEVRLPAFIASSNVTVMLAAASTARLFAVGVTETTDGPAIRDR